MVNININRPLHIVDISSHNINMGDGAIHNGKRNWLSMATGREANWTNLDIVDFASPANYYTADDINALNPDLLIIGGGGTIDGHISRETTGFAFTTPKEELSKIKCPIVFLALGHNSFRGQEFHHSDKLDEYIKFCAAENIPFTVRRDGSKKRLGNILSEESMAHIGELPDPGFFVSTRNDIGSPFIAPAGKYSIVIQAAVDGYSHRFGDIEGGDMHLTSKFFSSLSDVAQKLIEIDSSICMAQHTTDDILSTIPMLTGGINKFLIRLRFYATGVMHPIHADKFFTAYRDADLVIGMRGHSVICGAGLGTPIIALSSHDKVTGFMEEIDAKDQIMEIEDFDADKLFDMAVNLLNSPEDHLARIKKATENWGAELAGFFRSCL